MNQGTPFNLEAMFQLSYLEAVYRIPYLEAVYPLPSCKQYIQFLTCIVSIALPGSSGSTPFPESIVSTSLPGSSWSSSLLEAVDPVPSLKQWIHFLTWKVVQLPYLEAVDPLPSLRSLAPNINKPKIIMKYVSSNDTINGHVVHRRHPPGHFFVRSLAS